MNDHCSNNARVRWALLAGAMLIAPEALAQTGSPASPPAGPVSAAQDGSSVGQMVAQAGSPSSHSAQGGASDLIVTARRRAERLQDIPVAVSVVSGAGLAQRGITNVVDIGKAVPAVQFAPAQLPGVPAFTIRSQRQSDILLEEDPSVGVSFAEVPLARDQGVNGAFFDIANVQVLKGPQGTLFGRNTTGGVILIAPKDPTDVFGGYLKGSAGSFAERSFEGAVNVPLAHGLDVRVAGTLNRRDGYLHNDFNGRDLGDVHNEGARVSVKWQPATNFSNKLVVDYFHADENGAGETLVAIAPNPSPALVQALADQEARGKYHVSNNGPVGTYIRTYTISNISQLDLGSITIKNIIGYRNVKDSIFVDDDGTGSSFLHSGDITNVHQISDELQLQGKALSNNLNYIIGAFFFREHGSQFTGNDVFGTQRDLNSVVTNSSKSVFAQATYKLPFAQAVSLTAGVRYTSDRRHVTDVNTSTAAHICYFTDANNVPLDPCEVTASKTFNKPTYTLSADWKVTRDVLVYITSRRGYRTGGFNTRATTVALATLPFKPETVTDYEAGIKTSWRLAGIHGTLNLDGYHQNYKDIQRAEGVVAADGTFLGSTVTNAAKATINGFEVEGAASLPAGFTLSGFFSYSHPKYLKFLQPAVVGGMLVEQDYSGTPFGGAPLYSGGGTVSWDLPINHDIGTITASTSVYAQSHTYVADGLYDPVAKQPFASGRMFGYTTVNARLEWDNALGTKVGAALFVNNLTNKFYYTSGLDTSRFGIGTSAFNVAAPRMYGFELSYKF